MVRKILFIILILAILVLGVYEGPEISTVLASALVELKLPADTIQVSSNKQIIDAVIDTIKAGENIVNFDTRELEEPIDADSAIYSIIMASHPDLGYVKEIRSHFNEDRQFLSAEIVYRYYVNNQDVFCVIDRPGLFALLDKRVLLTGESFQITLTGEISPKYTLQISSDDSLVQIGEDSRIIALGEGIAHLTVTITDKLDSRREYIHTFETHILPKDVRQIEDIEALLAAAREGMHKPKQPVLIRNQALRRSEMQKALRYIGEGLIKSQLNDEMTAIDNVTKSGVSLTECAQKIDMIEEKAAEIVSRITRPEMTELEKEMALYDYLIQNTQYDYRVYDDPENYPFDSGTSYGPLFTGMGVCTGYSYAFMALMRTVGIESFPVLGTYQGEYHMWNIAKIDGTYYQMDPTFDSVYTHTYRQLSHVFFNKSDAQMRKDHDWDMPAYPPCTDTRYD